MLNRREWLCAALAATVGVQSARRAGAECDCPGNFRSLAAERLALPAVYDAIFGLDPPHTREYWQAKLSNVSQAPQDQWDASDCEVAAAAQSGLGHDDKAAELWRWRNEHLGATSATALSLTLSLAHTGEWDDAAKTVEFTRDPRKEWLRFGILHHEALTVRMPAKLKEHLLGVDVNVVLQQNFRVQPPVVENHGKPSPLDPEPEKHAQVRARQEASLWRDLNLPPYAFDGLVAIRLLTLKEQPEPMMALADLLAAASYRRLAWHAYQRAWDLEHPNSDDIVLYQTQVASPLPDAERYQLVSARHYAMRRTARNWARAWQGYERRLVKEGGDPDDASRWTQFYEEHPRP